MSKETYEQGRADGYCDGWRDGEKSGIKQSEIVFKRHVELKNDIEEIKKSMAIIVKIVEHLQENING